MSDNTNSFKGMTVLVTGASGGIGAATAVAFASRGAHVLAHYNRQEKEAAEVLARVQEAGSSGELLRADLSRMEGVRALVQDVTGRPIDILVNNAGSLVRRTRVLDFTEELWEEVMTLNLDSAFFLAQAVLRDMAERKRGFIVNVSSVAARNGGGLGALAYATAKGALSTMTKGLAKEFAPMGIRVNAVSPGTIDTNYHRTFSTDQMLNGVKAATPMGRLGTSEEIADVILFLCGPAARFMQGQVVEVNGGFLMV
jgi:NAD(P)-dependent dehydrogenase (short-subunit alcohol dehydrogenase family)